MVDPYICEICSRKRGRDVRHVRGKVHALHAGYARGIKITGPVIDTAQFISEKDFVKLYTDNASTLEDDMKQLYKNIDPSLKDVDFEVEFDCSPTNKETEDIISKIVDESVEIVISKELKPDAPKRGWLARLRNRLKRRKKSAG